MKSSARKLKVDDGKVEVKTEFEACYKRLYDLPNAYSGRIYGPRPFQLTILYSIFKVCSRQLLSHYREEILPSRIRGYTFAFGPLQMTSQPFHDEPMELANESIRALEICSGRDGT